LPPDVRAHGYGPSPSESLQAEERAEAVRRAIAALPEELRLPLILAEYEGRSQAEISEILGCSVKAVTPLSLPLQTGLLTGTQKAERQKSVSFRQEVSEGATNGSE